MQVSSVTTHRRRAAGGLSDIRRVRLREGWDAANRGGGEEQGGKHVGVCVRA